MAKKFKRGEDLYRYRLRGTCPEDGIKRNKNTRDRQTLVSVFFISECLRKIQGYQTK